MDLLLSAPQPNLHVLTNISIKSASLPTVIENKNHPTHTKGKKEPLLPMRASSTLYTGKQTITTQPYMSTCETHKTLKAIYTVRLVAGASPENDRYNNR